MSQIELRFYELACSFFSKMLHPSKAKDEIDWEQRRYEIAKDIYVSSPNCTPNTAVRDAEELIAELKK